LNILKIVSVFVYQYSYVMLS